MDTDTRDGISSPATESPPPVPSPLQGERDRVRGAGRKWNHVRTSLKIDLATSASPIGTTDNSPPFQRRVSPPNNLFAFARPSRRGRAKANLPDPFGA
jgi:hypothetical protein